MDCKLELDHENTYGSTASGLMVVHWSCRPEEGHNPIFWPGVQSDNVRATAVGRGAERDAVLAGDPKGLVYYVMID